MFVEEIERQFASGAPKKTIAETLLQSLPAITSIANLATSIANNMS